jgi:hypothetical protein
MAWPIVTVASGGLPVTEAGAFGAPVEEAANGYGTPVTFVASGGLPVTNLAYGASTAAGAYLGSSEPSGLSLVFDQATPNALVRGGSSQFSGDPNSLLTYTFAATFATKLGIYELRQTMAAGIRVHARPLSVSPIRGSKHTHTMSVWLLSHASPTLTP